MFQSRKYEANEPPGSFSSPQEILHFELSEASTRCEGRIAQHQTPSTTETGNGQTNHWLSSSWYVLCVILMKKFGAVKTADKASVRNGL